MNTWAIGSRKSRSMACTISKVQTAYIPSGKTAPQYKGSYLSGMLEYRQTTRIRSIGIHQVPVAQKKIVNPLRNGISVSRKAASAAFSINSEPANVEMAIAPILIQYGDEKSAGENLKNV